jgi:hypothetical protein
MEDTNNIGTPAPTEAAIAADTSVDQSNNTDESSEDGATATTPPAITAAEKKRINKLLLKIDGADFEETLPFDIDEEHADWMKKNLQMSKVSQKRMQETKNLESQVKQFVQALKGDTRNTLKQMGIDPKEFAAAVIEDEMKLQAMTPEQRERQELEAKLKNLQDERQKEKEDFERKELERLQQLEYEKIDAKMGQAIEKSGLPKNPAVVKKMADYMLLGLQNGVTLEPEDVVDLVREEIHSDLQSLIRSLGEDNVESFIGKDVLNKIRKKNISKAKQTPATAKAGMKDVSVKPVEVASEKKSFKKFFGSF